MGRGFVAAFHPVEARRVLDHAAPRQRVEGQALSRYICQRATLPQSESYTVYATTP